MFSLSYSSAYDPYHAIFRHIALLKSAPKNCMAARTLRVADFFICFPWIINDLKAPRTIAGFAKQRNALLKKYTPTIYDNIPNPRVVFERMEPMQIAAISAMLGSNFISREEYGAELTCLREEEINENIMINVNLFIQENKDLIIFLSQSLPRIHVFGEDGIFSRSGLGEYKYDIV